MEFFIKKGANLPAIRLLVVQDGRSDYVTLMETLVDSKVFFSMANAATGIPKIALAPCEIIPFYQPDGTIEYYINFKFSNRDTNKPGRYRGEFIIQNPDGTRILPLREEIFINVQDTFVSIDNCCTDTIGNFNSLELIAEVFYGSVDIVYTLTSFTPVPVNVRVDFTNIFYTYTGSSLTITTGVTINAGNTIGTTIVNFPDEDPNNLTRYSTISNIVIVPSQLSDSFTITEEIIFPTPTPTPSVTPDPTPTPTVTSTETEQVITDAILTTDGDYIEVGYGIYLSFIDPTPNPTPTQTPTPTITPTQTSTQTPTPSITPTYTPTNTQTPTKTSTPTPTPTTPITCDTFTFNSINANTTINSAIKTTGGGWNASAYSVGTYTNPVSVTFNMSNSNIGAMGGFSVNPTLSESTYENATFGLYSENVNLKIYENGNNVYTVFEGGNITPSDLFKVEYDGTVVKYYYNDSLVYTSLQSITQPLHIFFPLLTENEGVINVCVIETPLPTPTQTPTNTETPTPTPTIP